MHVCHRLLLSSSAVEQSKRGTPSSLLSTLQRYHDEDTRHTIRIIASASPRAFLRAKCNDHSRLYSSCCCTASQSNLTLSSFRHLKVRLAEATLMYAKNIRNQPTSSKLKRCFVKILVSSACVIDRLSISTRKEADPT